MCVIALRAVCSNDQIRANVIIIQAQHVDPANAKSNFMAYSQAI